MAYEEFQEDVFMTMFQDHISFSQLADYAEGRLLPDEQAGLESHIASCSQCTKMLIRLQRVIDFLQTGEDAPAPVIKRAVDLFRSRAASESSLSGLRRRIQAVLHFDSARLVPAFGIRSAKSRIRQMLFDADGREIDLRIQPEGQAWIVSGQLLGEAALGATAILHGDVEIHESTVNELSEFSFAPVAAGSYRLSINLTNVDVEISEIRIG
jgi:hypothetical protein